jgi:hypothetical protein
MDIKGFLKRQGLFWGPIVLAGAGYLTPSVNAWAASHPAYGAALLAIWAKLLHRADPPQG